MIYQTDVLIIGSGIAGLSAGLRLADRFLVTIINKNSLDDCNTKLAQGGIAARFDGDDTFEDHIEDTFRAGADLCHDDSVRITVENAPEQILWLKSLGVRFSMDQRDSFDLGREGGHRKRRIVHASDFTGDEVERVLLERAKEHPNIRFFERFYAVDLITDYHLTESLRTSLNKTSCYGSYVYDRNKNQVDKIVAKKTIVATGGVGAVYQHTTNVDGTVGDGVAMAFRAGAEVMNLEFMQFHPTAFYNPGNNGRTFLISEAVRGFGGVLVNKEGDSFLDDVHPLKSLAPRDIVARAIDRYLKKSGDDCVYIVIENRTKDEIVKRFPNIYQVCLDYGVDITKGPIPVVPAAHYMCGGVKTDLNGLTNIDSLYALGESAATGLHGANRLASNSLLEALVFGYYSSMDIARAIQDSFLPQSYMVPDWDDNNTFNMEEWILIKHDKENIKKIMWDYVGIVRNNQRLERALARIQLILNEVNDFYKRTKINSQLLELRNMATAALLMVQSALSRKESRGLHYNTDFPEQSTVLKDTVFSRQY